MRVDSDTGKASLTVAEAFPRHAGSYTLVATNAAGEARCGCDVTVAGLPPCGTSDSEAASDAEAAGPSIKRALNDVSVREGESALLECVIVGYPEPEVRPWRPAPRHALPPVFTGRALASACPPYSLIVIVIVIGLPTPSCLFWRTH